MSDLMEQPVLITVVGLVATIILVSGLVKTGERRILYAIAAVILLFGGLLIVERIVKTEREQLRQTLYQIAADVQRNDLDAVLGHVHSNAHRVQQRARHEMPRYDFSEVRITKIKRILVGDGRNAGLATTEFSARANLTTRGHKFDVPRFVIFNFRKEDDRWKVVNYEHLHIAEAMIKRK